MTVGATTDPRDDELLAALGSWLPGRRWFPAKGAGAAVAVAGGITLDDPVGEAEVRLLLVRVTAPGLEALVHVPLALRTPDRPGPGEVLGSVRGFDLSDACGDPAFVRAWLRAAERPAGAPPAGPVVLDAPPRVMSGEQSNTSVVLPAGAAAPRQTLLKVFRTLWPGDNPDVGVPRALTEAGWDHVPRMVAWLPAGWRPAGTTEPVLGDLAVLSEFVPDAEDGFELACAMARRGESFAGPATELGAVIGQMHQALARALPVPRLHAQDVGDASSDADAELVAGALAERFAWAAAVVPRLHEHEPAVAELLARTRALRVLPARQRVHGDLHLGQVLRSAGSWFVIDFEGEPLAPVAARVRPDLALRDVAGMLRSFDYAAAVGQAAPGWSDAARVAFLAGYEAESADLDPVTRRHLLRVLELDKALYEAVYEARNRPDWLDIPLAGIARLLH